MRVLLGLLLPFLSLPSACAEWLKVDDNDSAAFYYDAESIRKSGNRNSVWEMHDLKQPDPDGALSVRALAEYDCSKGRRRLLSFSGFSEPMGRGEVLYFSNDVSGWHLIPPHTIAEALLRRVCHQ